MHRIPEQPIPINDRVMITLRAPADDGSRHSSIRWSLLDALVASTGIVIVGWLLLPILLVLRVIGRYRRLSALHPHLGPRSIGWLGHPPAHGALLRFPRPLIPLMLFDLAIGSVSLRPRCRHGWMSDEPAPASIGATAVRRNNAIIDLRSDSHRRNVRRRGLRHPHLPGTPRRAARES